MSKQKTTQNKKQQVKEWIVISIITLIIVAICATLIVLVVKFYDGPAHEEGGTEAPTSSTPNNGTSGGNSSGTTEEKDDFNYPKYDSVKNTETEGAVYNISTTGTGVNVDMSKVVSQINSYQHKDFAKTDEATDFVVVRFQSFGDVVIALRPDIAPKTVANFKGLVSKGFYNNTVIDRIMDFMIEGGMYSKTGESKKADTIVGEFTRHGYVNNLEHVEGVISMGRASDRDSASSKFFIMSRESKDLNGYYASFGYVLAGYDVIEKVSEVELKNPDNKEGSAPTTPVIVKEIFYVEPKSGSDLAVETAPADKRVEYKLTVKDSEGKALKDVRFKLMDAKTGKTIIEKAYTNENGEAKFNINVSDYHLYITDGRGSAFEEYYLIKSDTTRIELVAKK